MRFRMNDLRIFSTSAPAVKSRGACAVCNAADSLYERLVHENPTTKDGVDAIMASCEQVPIPMSESMWGSDRVLATNETCIQYRVCGLASCPIDVVYADGTNVVHVYPSYE